MTPILARCTRCGGAFPLIAVVEDGTGSCPHCRQPLVAGPPAPLIEWAAVAEASHYRLASAARLMRQLGGHLAIDWQSALESLAEETGPAVDAGPLTLRIVRRYEPLRPEAGASHPDLARWIR